MENTDIETGDKQPISNKAILQHIKNETKTCCAYIKPTIIGLSIFAITSYALYYISSHYFAYDIITIQEKHKNPYIKTEHESCLYGANEIVCFRYEIERFHVVPTILSIPLYIGCPLIWFVILPYSLYFDDSNTTKTTSKPIPFVLCVISNLILCVAISHYIHQHFGFDYIIMSPSHDNNISTIKYFANDVPNLSTINLNCKTTNGITSCNFYPNVVSYILHMMFAGTFGEIGIITGLTTLGSVCVGLYYCIPNTFLKIHQMIRQSMKRLDETNRKMSV